MPSILRLDPTRVGPRDPFTLTLTDNSLDFTVVGRHIQWFLRHPSSGTGALYQRVPSATVLDARRISLVIDSVGPNVVTQVPVGMYMVVGRLSFWEGNSDRWLQAVATSQTQPPPSAPSPATLVPRAMARFRFASATVPWRIAGFFSRLTVVLNILGQRLGLAGPLFQVAPPLPPRPTPPPSRIAPLIDGEHVFPAIAEVIRQSEHFCLLATWGMDEDVRLNNVGQADPPSMATLLRSQSVALARLAESRANRLMVNRVHGDVRALIWDATLDDDFSGFGNNIGTLGTVEVPWRDVRRLNGTQTAAYLRDQGLSGEARELLAAVHGYFRQLRHPPGAVAYPSGVLATTQNHPASSTFGSHHQKFCVTEKNAYVGGLNFHRDYWDRNEHRLNDAGRASSRGPGSGGSGEGPLHDCGAILGDVYAQNSLRRLMALRWDDAIATRGGFEGYIRTLRRMRSHAHQDDVWVYSRIIDTLARTPRTLMNQAPMRSPITPSPVGEPADHLWVNLTLPPGMPGFPQYGERQILAAYRQIIGWMGPPSTLGYIETQYFDHKGLAEDLLTSWRYRNPGREDPMVHIVIPYIPDTHWLDPVVWRRILRHEFRHLRWCEIHSMQTMLEPDGSGAFRETHVVRADTRIQVNATMDTLEPDTEVHFTDIYLVTGGRVPRMTRRVRDFMTKGGIVVYTLAMDDAPAPSAGGAIANQRHYLETHGIYIHSKTAILIDEDNTAHTSATTGSANLTPRSLDAPDRDSEVNVWWRHHDRIRQFFETLVREHTGGGTDSYSIQEAGLDALNRIRTGRQPGRHLVRLDLADRKLHKD